MKCPKCNYISFDYNQVCPKCNKDIASEQKKLNLPSFKPSPPSLLGTLTGEASESHPDLHPEDLEGTMQMHRELDLAADDLMAAEAGEAPTQESLGLELRVDAEGPEELGETISIERAAAVPPLQAQPEVPLEDAILDLKADEEELLLEPEEVLHEGVSAEAPSVQKVVGEEKIMLDLSELETEGEAGAPKDEEGLFAELKPEDLEEAPQERMALDKKVSAKGKIMDEAEMVTMEIEKAREGIEKELEEFDLEMDLEESLDKKE